MAESRLCLRLFLARSLQSMQPIYEHTHVHITILHAPVDTSHWYYVDARTALFAEHVPFPAEMHDILWKIWACWLAGKQFLRGSRRQISQREQKKWRIETISCVFAPVVCLFSADMDAMTFWQPIFLFHLWHDVCLCDKREYQVSTSVSDESVD